MDNYNEQEATRSKVKFSINPDGRIEFDATNLEEWQLTEALNEVGKQAKSQRQTTQKLKEVALTGEIVMHCLAIAFFTLLVGSVSFTASRVISGLVQSPGVAHVK